MLIAGVMALTIMENASQAFSILLLSGAGTGAIFLFRWFWWRINAITEIVGMTVATVNAFILVLWVPDEMLARQYIDGFTAKLLIGTCVTTIVWIITTFLTKPESDEKLQDFVYKIQPGIGWKRFENVGESSLVTSLMSVFIGTIGVYSALFGIGSIIYGKLILAVAMLSVFAVAMFLIFRWWNVKKL